MKFNRLISLFILSLIIGLPIFVGAEKPAGRQATVFRGTESQKIYARASTVGEALRKNGYNVEHYSAVFPAPASEFVEGMHIFLHNRSRSGQAQVAADQSPKKREISSRALPASKELVIQGGKAKAGKAEETSPRVVLNGQAEFKDERLQELKEKGTLKLLATAYSPHPLDTAPYSDGFSALGLPAGYGLIAVDPRFIPLGTVLYVEGYGYGIAADVGGDIKGRKIDLCFPERDDALLYGRQWTTAHIIS